MKRLFGAALVLMLFLGNLSCDDPTRSGPGILRVRLVAPAAVAGARPDSAIVFTVTGPAALTSVEAGAGLQLFNQQLGSTTTRFVLTGPLTNGATILTIGVPDIGALSEYSGEVEGVARADFQLRPRAAYGLALTR